MEKQQALFILGLPLIASQEEISKAWRAKARLFHPDSPYGNVERFLRCQTAFETLTILPKQAVRVPARSRAV